MDRAALEYWPAFSAGFIDSNLPLVREKRIAISPVYIASPLRLGPKGDISFESNYHHYAQMKISIDYYKNARVTKVTACISSDYIVGVRFEYTLQYGPDVFVAETTQVGGVDETDKKWADNTCTDAPTVELETVSSAT